MLARIIAFGLVLALASMRDAAHAQDRPSPIVLVLDTGDARVSGERIRQALAENLGRDVLRIVDERAGSAAGVLTVAYEGSRRWLVRFDASGASASRRERVLRPIELSS